MPVLWRGLVPFLLVEVGLPSLKLSSESFFHSPSLARHSQGSAVHLFHQPSHSWKCRASEVRKMARDCNHTTTGWTPERLCTRPVMLECVLSCVESHRIRQRPKHQPRALYRYLPVAGTMKANEAKFPLGGGEDQNKRIRIHVCWKQRAKTKLSHSCQRRVTKAWVFPSNASLKNLCQDSG